MRNLTLVEIKENKNFKEFCSLNGYSFRKIIKNLGSIFYVELLDENDVEFQNVDLNYPYQIFNPFDFDISLDI